MQVGLAPPAPPVPVSSPGAPMPVGEAQDAWGQHCVCRCPAVAPAGRLGKRVPPPGLPASTRAPSRPSHLLSLTAPLTSPRLPVTCGITSSLPGVASRSPGPSPHHRPAHPRPLHISACALWPCLLLSWVSPGVPTCGNPTLESPVSPPPGDPPEVCTPGVAWGGGSWALGGHSACPHGTCCGHPLLSAPCVGATSVRPGHLPPISSSALGIPSSSPRTVDTTWAQRCPVTTPPPSVCRTSLSTCVPIGRWVSDPVHALVRRRLGDPGLAPLCPHGRVWGGRSVSS